MIPSRTGRLYQRRFPGQVIRNSSDSHLDGGLAPFSPHFSHHKRIDGTVDGLFQGFPDDPVPFGLRSGLRTGRHLQDRRPIAGDKDILDDVPLETDLEVVTVTLGQGAASQHASETRRR